MAQDPTGVAERDPATDIGEDPVRSAGPYRVAPVG